MAAATPHRLSSVRHDKVEEYFAWAERTSLGSGTFGDVFKALCVKEHPTDHPSKEGLVVDRHYAVKVLKKEKLKVPKHWKNVLHEIEILKRVESSYVIQLHDAFQTEHEIYLVLELVDGGELFDVIMDRGRLTEQEAREITRQLMEALSYLHREKIVHRDLKPENILINRETMRIKLIDFGFAKFFGKETEAGFPLTPSLTQAQPQLKLTALSPNASIPSTPSDLVVNTPLGSLKYLAPEILNSLVAHGVAPRVTTRQDIQRLDIFSVGVVMYVMLGGAFPFSSKSKAGLAAQIERGIKFPEPRFKEVSQEAKDFCGWLLGPDRRKRPLAVQTFSHAWLVGAVPNTPLQVDREATTNAIDTGLWDQMRMQDDRLDKGGPEVLRQAKVVLESVGMGTTNVAAQRQEYTTIIEKLLEEGSEEKAANVAEAFEVLLSHQETEKDRAVSAPPPGQEVHVVQQRPNQSLVLSVPGKRKPKGAAAQRTAGSPTTTSPVVVAPVSVTVNPATPVTPADAIPEVPPVVDKQQQETTAATTTTTTATEEKTSGAGPTGADATPVQEGVDAGTEGGVSPQTEETTTTTPENKPVAEVSTEPAVPGEVETPPAEPVVDAAGV